MKKKLAILTAAFMLTSVLMGCGSASNAGDASEETTETAQDSSQTSESDDQAEAEMHEKYDTAIHKVDDLPQLNGPKDGDKTATIHTSMGDIKVWFFPEYAPKAVENFTVHSDEGYYDNLIFHRVIDQFMIQGGDPEGTGAGGESIWGEVFENEVDTNLRSFRGSLCMANAGPDTNGSQFYIVQSQDIGDDFKSQLEELETSDETFYETSDGTVIKFADVFTKDVVDEYVNNGGYPSLDFQYTVFGQVYEGMDVVDAIAAVETDDSDKPLTDVVIQSIETGVYNG